MKILLKWTIQFRINKRIQNAKNMQKIKRIDNLHCDHSTNFNESLIMKKTEKYDNKILKRIFKTQMILQL